MTVTRFVDDSTPSSERSYLELANRHAAETEARGRLHTDVVEALTASGVLRRWASQPVGGESASVTDVLGSIERASRADGTTGWCIMIANTTALTSHRLPQEWADIIYGDPGACTGGFGMPAGVATVVDGGLEVSGRWSWGSGTDHCTWIGGGVRVVDENGTPTTTRDGAFAPFVFFEPSQVDILDTWQVSGLKGTASSDYTVTKALVPEGRWAQLVGAEPRIEGPLGRFPFFGALGAGVSAVTIGLAERAIDELLALAGKQASGSKRTLAERAPAQADLSLARAGVAQARSYLHQTTDQAWKRASRGANVSDDTKVEIRLAATAAAIRSVEAVDLCYHAAGGAAIFEGNALQRVFRDVHVAISHGMIAPRTLEPLGRYSFGLETNTALF